MSSFGIDIPEPCSQSWEGMTPTACGRFCNACQKEVIDISKMDDETILQKYLENDGQLCVRARADQISPTRITSQIRMRSFAYAKLALFALALWTVFSGGLVREVLAQSPMPTVQMSDENTFTKLHIAVKDKNGEAISNARILLFKEGDFIDVSATKDSGSTHFETLKEAGTYLLSVYYDTCKVEHFIILKIGTINEIAIHLQCLKRDINTDPGDRYNRFFNSSPLLQGKLMLIDDQPKRSVNFVTKMPRKNIINRIRERKHIKSQRKLNKNTA